MEDLPIEQVPDIGNWSENYAISSYDPERNIQIHIHLGRWRKDLSLWREVVVIHLPDSSAIAYRAIGPGRGEAKGPGACALSLDIDPAGGRIGYRFLGAARRVPALEAAARLPSDGPLERVEFELVFTSSLPTWDLHQAGDNIWTDHPGEGPVVARGHIEQPGRFEGTIKVGADEFIFSSLANRDHSRGPRVVDSIQRHVWFQAMLDNGDIVLGFDAQSEGSETSDLSEGCIYRRGSLLPATIRILNQLPLENAYAHLGDPVTIEIESEGQRMVLVAAEFPSAMSTQYTAPWDLYAGRFAGGGRPFRSVSHQSVRFTINGEISGYGHVERTVPGTIWRDDDPFQLTG